MAKNTLTKKSGSLTIEIPQKTSQQTSMVFDYASSELKRIVGGKYHGIISLNCSDKTKDGFQISSDRNSIKIFGNNPRSLLFGVFRFLQRFAGYRWFHPGEEIRTSQKISAFPSDINLSETPSFSRRYFFPEETFFTFSLLKNFIDWAPRNMIGDITLSFSAWDKWKLKLIPEILRRGLGLTLSGHCLRMFVPQDEFINNPDLFALVGGQRINSGQYCYSNPELQKVLAERLEAFLSKDSIISRLSIWAEDNALICECENCRKKGFLKSFAECISNVAAMVKRMHNNVDIDFLAYNAGLAWEMLEPPQSYKPGRFGMEIAYWGRDYRYAIGGGNVKADHRANECIKEWRKLTKGSISVLEYYTDIWLFTHLIPLLPQRIAADASEYANMGIDAIGSLICLAPPEIYQKKLIRDEYANLIFPNLYFFAASAWDAQINVKAMMDDYTSGLYGQDAEACRKYIQKMTRILLKIQSYNRTLFRLRFVDIWQRDIQPDEGGILFKPEDWTPEVPWNRDEKRRFVDCEKMVAAMSKFQSRYPLKIVEKNPDCRQRTKALQNHWNVILSRLNAIFLQLRAQHAIYEGNIAAAHMYLTKALKMKTGVISGEEKYCRKWLDKLQTNRRR